MDWGFRSLSKSTKRIVVSFFVILVPDGSDKFSLSTLWQYTAGLPPLSQPPKLLMAIRSSSGFSHLRLGVFHISLRTHNPQHAQMRGWKKRKTNNNGLGLAPSARREKSLKLSSHSVLLWANASVYSSEIPTKPQRNADSSSHVGQPGLESPHPSSPLLSPAKCPVLFCWLVCSVYFSWLTPSADWLILLTVGPFFPRPLSDKEILWLAPTPTETNSTQRVTTLEFIYPH